MSKYIDEALIEQELEEANLMIQIGGKELYEEYKDEVEKFSAIKIVTFIRKDKTLNTSEAMRIINDATVRGIFELAEERNICLGLADTPERLAKMIAIDIIVRKGEEYAEKIHNQYWYEIHREAGDIQSAIEYKKRM